MELSIVITSYRNPALLELCINSLRKCVGSIVHEIIVADCGSQQDTIDLMRHNFSEIIFLPNEQNIGFGRLVNQGLAKAKGNFLFVMNADIIIKDKEVIPSLVNFLKKQTDVGMVGPKLINFDNSTQPSCFRFYQPMTIIFRRTFLKNYGLAKKHLDSFLMHDVDLSKPVEADWIMGSSMMVSRAAYEKVGPMDTERFWMYFEDVDWCWRFWENGFKVIYNPDVSVFHYHGKQSGSNNALKSLLLNRYTRTHIKSAINFFIKYAGKENPHQRISYKNN